MLGGPKAHYQVSLPGRGEGKRAILDTYTKEHSAEYQSQALIDLAFRLGKKIADWDAVDEVLVETSHHTHYVIGSGSNDPQKFDPEASRETLDHSIMYILAVALQDGVLAPCALLSAGARAPGRHRAPVAQDQDGRGPPVDFALSHAGSGVKAFGGKIIIRLKDGTEIADELAVANAHSLGATPWKRPDYIRKFETLTDGLLDPAEAKRFLELVQRLPALKPEEVLLLNVAVPAGALSKGAPGLF